MLYLCCVYDTYAFASFLSLLSAGAGAAGAAPVADAAAAGTGAVVATGAGADLPSAAFAGETGVVADAMTSLHHTPHHTMHTHTRLLYDCEMRAVEIQALAMHATIQVFHRCALRSKRDKRRATKKLENFTCV